MAPKGHQTAIDKKFHFSCFTGDADSFNTAIECGATIDPGLALRDAASAGNTHILKLLQERGVDVAKHGERALMSAAVNGQIECVDFLLNAGVDANADDGAAIVAAAGHCQTLVVDRLIMAGARTEKALATAVFWWLANEGMDGENGYRAMVDCLIASKADIKIARAMLMGDIKGCGDEFMENKVKANRIWKDLQESQSQSAYRSQMLC